MNVIVNEDNRVGVMSDLYVAGRDEDGREIHGESFYVVMEFDDGQRLRHGFSFQSVVREVVATEEEDLVMWVQTEAKEKAERLAERIRQAGTINTERWSFMDPRYGSAAYVDLNIEQDQILREKRAA